MKARKMGDAEIKLKGIDSLNKALGPAAALRFLALLHTEPTDYVEISRDLYQGQTIEQILARARSRKPA